MTEALASVAIPVVGCVLCYAIVKVHDRISYGTWRPGAWKR